MTGPPGPASHSEVDSGPSGHSKAAPKGGFDDTEVEKNGLAAEIPYVSEPSLSDSMDVENETGPHSEVKTELKTEPRTESPSSSNKESISRGAAILETIDRLDKFGADTAKPSSEESNSVSPPFVSPGEVSPTGISEPLAEDGVSSKDAPPVQVNQTPFIQKLYSMLEDKSLDKVISWSPTEDSFHINPGEDFSNTLCLYFKHTNITSFVRQLSMYGFHKVSQYSRESSKFRSENIDPSSLAAADSWEFKHADGTFRRNDFTALRGIRRRSSRRQSRKRTFERHVVVPQEQRWTHSPAPYLAPPSATQSPHQPHQAEQIQQPHYQALPMISQVFPLGRPLYSSAKASPNLHDSMAMFPPHQVNASQPQLPPQPQVVQAVHSAGTAPVAMHHQAVPQAYSRNLSGVSSPAIPAHMQTPQIPQTSQIPLPRTPLYSKEEANAEQNNSVSSWISSQSHNYMVFPELSRSSQNRQALPHPIQSVASGELVNRVLSKQRDLEGDIASLQQHVGHLGRSAGELGLLVQLLTAPPPTEPEAVNLSMQSVHQPNIVRPHSHSYDRTHIKGERPYIPYQVDQLSSYATAATSTAPAGQGDPGSAPTSTQYSINGTYRSTTHHPTQSANTPTVNGTGLSTEKLNAAHRPNGAANSLSTGEPMSSYKEQPGLVQPRNLQEGSSGGDANASSNGGSNSNSHRAFTGSSNGSSNGDSNGDSNEYNMIDDDESTPDGEKSGSSEPSTSATSGCSGESPNAYQSKPERVPLQALLN